MLQLEKLPIEYHGQTYELVCNMEALEALQDEYGGDLNAVSQDTDIRVGFNLFRILLNLARAEKGEDAVTEKQIKKEYNWAMLKDMDILGLLTRSTNLKAAREKIAEDAAAAEEPAKN